MTNVRGSYKEQLEDMKNFVEERINLRSRKGFLLRKAYDTYLNWCALHEGAVPFGKVTFALELEERFKIPRRRISTRAEKYGQTRSATYVAFNVGKIVVLPEDKDARKGWVAPHAHPWGMDMRVNKFAYRGEKRKLFEELKEKAVLEALESRKPRKLSKYLNILLKEGNAATTLTQEDTDAERLSVNVTMTMTPQVQQLLEEEELLERRIPLEEPCPISGVAASVELCGALSPFGRDHDCDFPKGHKGNHSWLTFYNSFESELDDL